MTDTSFDYTLAIDFERCHLMELRGIANCLLTGGSSMCLPDFYDLVGEMIKRMRKIGESLRENIQMVKFLKDIFATLRKIKDSPQCSECTTQLMIILQREYNECMGYPPPSPVLTPVTSPEVKSEVKPPTFMKKAKRRLKRD